MGLAVHTTAQANVTQVKDRDYFPVVVVANKCDLEYERQVQPHEGRDLAKRFGAQCIETSAKQRVNVDDAFVAVVRAIRRYQRVSTEAWAKGCTLERRAQSATASPRFR